MAVSEIAKISTLSDFNAIRFLGTIWHPDRYGGYGRGLVCFACEHNHYLLLFFFSLMNLSATSEENGSTDKHEIWRSDSWTFGRGTFFVAVTKMAAISKMATVEKSDENTFFIGSAWNRVFWVNRVLWTGFRKRKFSTTSGFRTMAAKIVKISTLSDFNEILFLGMF